MGRLERHLVTPRVCFQACRRLMCSLFAISTWTLARWMRITRYSLRYLSTSLHNTSAYFCFFKKQMAFNVRMLKSRHDALFYSVHRPIQSLFGHFMLLFSHKAKRLNHCCKVNKKSRHPNKYSPVKPFNCSCRALEKAKNKLISAIKGWKTALILQFWAWKKGSAEPQPFVNLKSNTMKNTLQS